MRGLWALLALTACTGRVCWFGACVEDQAPPSQTSDTGPCADAPSWDGFTQPFLTTWCTPCHSSSLTGDSRLGAPEGMNFDTWEGANTWASLILNASTGPDPLMPPAGGPTEEELEHLTEWVSCGAPGEPTPQITCTSPKAYKGDVAIASAAEAEVLCAGGDLRIEGDLVVAGDTEGALACVCSIQGDLRVDVTTAQHLHLAELREVGAEISIRSNLALNEVTLPKLTSTGSDLRLVANPMLSALSVPQLEHIAGDLRISEDGLGGSLTIDDLHTLDGALQVLENPRLESLATPRLANVAGSWRVEDNATLHTLEYTDTLTNVGEDLSLTGNPLLNGWIGFTRVESVGGDITIANNPSFTEFDGFHVLGELTGSFHLENHASMERIVGLHLLEDMSGSVVVSGAPVLNRMEILNQLEHLGGDLTFENTNAYRVLGFESLSSIDGHLALKTHPRMTLFESLPVLEMVGGDVQFSDLSTLELLELSVSSIGGSLEVSDNASLQAIYALPNLHTTGHLTVSGNPMLMQLRGLYNLTHVQGSATIFDNAQLPDLTGLGTLEQVDGNFSLVTNASLTRLKGLDALVRIGQDLRIQGNPSLPLSQIETLLDRLGDEGVEGEILTD